MNFPGEKASVVFKTMSYQESWRLPPKVARVLFKSLSTIRPATAETGTILYINNPPVESQAFRRYLGGLKRIAHGENVPLVAHIAVTDRCDYRCGRCSNRFMRGDAQADPPIDKLLGLLESLKKAGTVSVTFTGGEPALRDDLCKLVEACGPEIAPSLFTSGQRIDAQRAKEFRRAGLVSAVVSLDSNLEAEHDAIRGQPGAFKQAVQAIRCFLDAGLYTAAQAVADARLLAHRARLDEFVRFCGGLGVHEIVLLDPMVFGGSSDNKGPGRDDREYLKRLHLKSATNRSMPKVTTAAYLESSDYLGCLAGYSFFYVSSTGELCPCDFVPMSFGNVFEMGFEPVFERAKTIVRRPCTNCLTARMVETSGLPACLPLSWEQTGKIYSQMKTDEPSAMMKKLVGR